MIKKPNYFVMTVCLLFISNSAVAEINYNALSLNHEIVAKYESGYKGYRAVSKDNYGGYSYGKLQISTKRKNNRLSTFDYFMRYIKKHDTQIYDKLYKAGGYEAAFKGDRIFVDEWNSLSSDKNFIELYNNFIFDTQIIPVYERLANNHYNNVLEWCYEDENVQAAINSMIIQHGPGGAYNIIKQVFMNKDVLNKRNFVEKLYDYRIMKFVKYKKRYLAEKADILNNLKKENIKQVEIKQEISILNKLYSIFS